jgi:MFS family permease
MFVELKVNLYNLSVVVFVALGTISTAYGFAIIGSTVGQPNFYTCFNLPPAGEPSKHASILVLIFTDQRPRYDHSTNMIGAPNSVNSAGAIISCLFNVWTCERYSRKDSMMLGSAILILGGALCGGSVNMALFLDGRFIAGWGAVMLACAVPMYQAEISTPQTRGAMVWRRALHMRLNIRSRAGWGLHATSSRRILRTRSLRGGFRWYFSVCFR